MQSPSPVHQPPPPFPGAGAREGERVSRVIRLESLKIPEPEPEPDHCLEIPSNDDRNALQFVDLHHASILYCPERGLWLYWLRGEGWKWDCAGEITERARLYVRGLEASCLGIADPKARAEAFKRANALGQAGKIESMLSLARSDARVVVPFSRLDADIWRVGLKNGSVDLRTGEFSPPDRSLFITKRLNAAYDPSAKCPIWKAFLEQTQPDAQTRRFLQQLAGYCLTGSRREHRWFFIYGSGSNGKSTFIEFLLYLAGDYGQTCPEHVLALNPHGTPPKADIAQWPGKRLLTGSEVGEGMKLNEALVKTLASEDTMRGEEKYKSPFDFVPQGKLLMFGNDRPVIKGTDQGIWRRTLLVPFTQSFSEEEKDIRLPEKLKMETDGILLWCLEGARDWLENGLVIPPAVKSATAEYRSTSDVLGEFLGDHVQEASGCSLPIKEVYAKYVSWCGDQGIRQPWTARTFNARLTDRGLQQAKTNGEKVWRNTGWLPENPALRAAAAAANSQPEDLL